MRILTLSIALATMFFTAPAFAQDVAFTDDKIPSGVESVVRISAFSGKPVPRFETLKYASVHGRTGPSLEYPIAWRYEKRGLPVLIVKESREWRMVRDPSGDEVWMHERMLGGHPGVLVYGNELIDLKTQPTADARNLARIEPGAVANLLDCTGAFCEVSLDRKKGWVSRSHLWGAPGTSAAPVNEHAMHLSGESVAAQ